MQDTVGGHRSRTYQVQVRVRVRVRVCVCVWGTAACGIGRLACIKNA